MLKWCQRRTKSVLLWYWFGAAIVCNSAIGCSVDTMGESVVDSHPEIKGCEVEADGSSIEVKPIRKGFSTKGELNRGFGGVELQPGGPRGALGPHEGSAVDEFVVIDSGFEQRAHGFKLGGFNARGYGHCWGLH